MSRNHLAPQQLPYVSPERAAGDGGAGERQIRRLAPCGPRILLRRLIYQMWPKLPVRARRAAVYLNAKKVTVGACAIIHDTHGHLLLAHHTYRERAWGLPGGLIRRGENVEEALRREVREELGVTSSAGPVLYTEMSSSGDHLTLYFAVTITATPRPDGIEIDRLEWVQVSEATQRLGAEASAWLDAIHHSHAMHQRRSA